VVPDCRQAGKTGVVKDSEDRCNNNDSRGRYENND
jgi:hypothetical protein